MRPARRAKSNSSHTRFRNSKSKPPLRDVPHLNRRIQALQSTERGMKMRREKLGILSVGSLYVLCSCSGAPPDAPNEMEPSEVEQSVRAAGCRPNFVLAASSNVVCKVDKDNHTVYNTFELSSADRYRDLAGCFPDAFQLRRIDSVSCSASTSAEDCIGRPGVLVGDFCPRPRLSEFAGTISAPATVPVQPGPLGAGSAYVCWNSSFDNAQIWVSGGGPERLFGTGRSGCQSESNINAGASRVFTLFTDSSRTINLADATTVGVQTACPPGTGPKCGEACYPLGKGCF